MRREKGRLGEREGKKGKVGRIYTSKATAVLKKWNGGFTDSRSSIGWTLQRKATTQNSLTPKNH